MKNLILTLLLLNGCYSFSQMLPENYVSFYSDLEMLSYESSLAKIEKAIKKNPTDPWYYWMSAGVYEMMGDQLNTVKNYEKSISLDSNFSAGHGRYARYLRLEENFDTQKALFHINKAIALDKSEAYYHIDKGEIYLFLKEYSLATEEVNLALKENQDHAASAMELMVKILHQQGKKSELIQYILKNEPGLNLDFMSTEVVLIVGNLYREIGEREKACSCFNIAREHFEMGEMPLPEALLESLQKCK